MGCRGAFYILMYVKIQIMKTVVVPMKNRLLCVGLYKKVAMDDTFFVDNQAIRK